MPVEVDRRFFSDADVFGISGESAGAGVGIRSDVFRSGRRGPPGSSFED